MLIVFPLAIVFAMLGYLIGLAVTAAPIWFVAHAMGLRSWWAAGGLGVALNTAAMLLAFVPKSPAAMVVTTALSALAGAAVGLTIWRVAYRKAETAADVFV